MCTPASQLPPPPPPLCRWWISVSIRGLTKVVAFGTPASPFMYLKYITQSKKNSQILFMCTTQQLMRTSLLSPFTHEIRHKQLVEWIQSIWIRSISDIRRGRSHTHTHQCMYVLVPPTTIGTRSLARTISVAALASLKNCPTVYSASWIHHHTSGNKAKFPQCTYLRILKPYSTWGVVTSSPGLQIHTTKRNLHWSLETILVPRSMCRPCVGRAMSRTWCGTPCSTAKHKELNLSEIPQSLA